MSGQINYLVHRKEGREQEIGPGISLCENVCQNEGNDS